MTEKLDPSMLLQLLKQAPESFALSDILELINKPTLKLSPPSDRTIRRWLNELSEQGLLIKTGSRKGTRYSLAAHQTTPNMLQFLQGLDTDIQLSTLKQIRNLWTHTSTALEGNTLSLGDTKFILDEGLTISGKPLKEHQEIYGHASAIELIYQNLNQAFTAESCFQLHLAIQTDRVTDIYKPNGAWKVEMNGTYAVNKKNQQVFIEYAHPLHTEKLMALFIEELNSLCKQTLNLKDGIKAYAKIHMGFVHIHPFWDGNGRLARLIANIPLLKSGLPPIVISQDERQQYIKILADYQLKVGQLTPDSGVWPKTKLLTDFEQFCDRSHKETRELIEGAKKLQEQRNKGTKE